MTGKRAMAVFLIGFAVYSGAGNLIPNGAFEQWKDGLPSGWTGTGIAEDRANAETPSARGVRIEAAPKAKGELISSVLNLNPDTEYQLSFYLRNGGMAVQLEGVPGALYQIGGPYVHRSGLRYYYRFRTPEKFQRPPRLVFRGGKGARTVSNVILTPASAAWNRPEFIRTGKRTAKCVFTLGNVTGNAQKIEAEMKLYDFFNKELFSKKESFTLSADSSKQFQTSFRTGDVKRYRAVLKYKAGNVSNEVWGYFNSDVVKGPRKSCDLTGWEFQFVQPGNRPAEESYSPVALPHVLPKARQEKPGIGHYRLILKPPFVPAKNERVFLNVLNASSSPEIFVNGKLAAKMTGRGCMRPDITALWNAKGTNEIRIICRDSSDAAAVQPQGGVRYKLPYTHQPGLNDQVLLETEPEIAVEGIKVETSLRDHALTVRGGLRNRSLQPGMFTVRQTVYGAGKKVFSLPEEQYYLIPNERISFRQSGIWKNPHLYFPHDPYLYLLETELIGADGSAVDRLRTRFGFREITIRGKHVLFNGLKCKFIGRLSAPHPRHAYKNGLNTLDEWMNRTLEHLQLVSGFGIVYGRDFGFDGRGRLYRPEIMDELGYMTRSSIEMNIAMTNYKSICTNDDKFWNAHTELAERYVRNFWNHPSIIEWDMENETFLCSSHLSYPAFADRFRTLRALVRGLDSTRPLLHDSADPQNGGDIISLHYPFEITRHLPPSAQFPFVPFEKNKLYTNLNLHPGAYQWKEDRPLMLGEDLIDLREQPQSASIFADESVYAVTGRGTEAYRGYDRDVAIGKINKALQMLGREYRKREVHVLTSWAIAKEMHRDELARDAVVIDEYHANFRSGEKTVRHYSYFHDPLNTFRAKIRWSLVLPDGRTVSVGERSLTVPGGELIQGKMELSMPETETALDAAIRIVVSDAGTGGTVAERELPVRIYPERKIAVPDKLRIAVYDPEGDSAKMFKRMGVRFSAVKTPVPPAGCTLFVIGRNGAAKLNAGFDEFTKKGGVVLVMEQQKGVPEVFPVRLAPANGMYWRTAFLRTAGHPLADGLHSGELQYWRGADHQVSSANYAKPVSGNAVAVFDAGTMGGYTVSPLLELTNGNGRYLFCQFSLTGKTGLDPVADKLFSNLLNYAAQPNFFRADQPLYFAGGDALRRIAALCGAEIREFKPGQRESGLLLLDARKKPTRAEVDSYLKFAGNGGTVWLQGISRENAEAFEPLTGKLEFSNDSGASLIKTANSRILPGLSNTDLYWLGVPEYDFYGKIFDDVGIGNLILNPPKPLKDAEQLVIYGALQRKPSGKGAVLIDALHWPESFLRVPMRAPRIPNAVMNAFGIRMTPSPFDRPFAGNTGFRPLPMKRLFNLDLNGTMPSGKTVLAGIPFELSGKGKGAMMLGSSILMNPKAKYPLVSAPLSVNGSFERLHLLLTLYNSYESGRGFGTGECVASVILNYADGSVETLPILQKVDAAHLFEVFGDLPRGKVAWRGLNPFSKILSWDTVYTDDEWTQTSGPNTVYAAGFCNPHPEKPVRSIVFRSTNQHFVPIIFAATAESRR